MAVAALLRSLASKMLHGGARSGQNPLLHQRGLHSLPNSGATGSTPPASKTDLVAALPKIGAGVAYVTLFGTLVYLHGSLVPRLDRLEAKVEARNSLENLNDDLATNVPRAQVMQNSAAHARHGEQPGIETKLNRLEAKLTKLEIALEAARSKRKA
ncbi:unnamed protein product [Urochloa humidicola]